MMTCFMCSNRTQLKIRISSMASLVTAEPEYLKQRHSFWRLKNKQATFTERPHGYKPEIILDSNGNEKYICSDCQWILKQPLQSFCGHRYCTDCFNYILSSQASTQPVKCKLCIQEGTESEFSVLKPEQTFPDNGVRRELEALKNHEPHCTYKQGQCTQCGSYFNPEELAEHLVNSCPMMTDRCPYCNTSMLKGLLMFHNCGEAPVQCAGCERKLPKKKLMEHSEHCASPSIPCPFGCNQVVQVANLTTHLTDNLHVHISELDRRIIELDDKMKGQTLENMPSSSLTGDITAMAASVTAITSDHKQQINEVKRRVEEMEAKISSVLNRIMQSDQSPSQVKPKTSEDAQHQFEILDRKILIFERVSAVFKREIDKCGKQIDNLLKDNQDNRSNLDRVQKELRTLEQQGKSQKAQIESLTKTVQILESASFDGQLIWKITDFYQLRQQAISSQTTSFYSPSFFTSKTGYKACARIYLNGDGMGKGTHVSLFFVLMRGEYDSLLPWPFQQKVTMVWIDQLKKNNIIDTFRPDPTSSSFKKPVSDMNIASGCPLFMKLHMIDDANLGYVRNDTAFIKISIDTSNLTGV
ncbi:hypothetical protein LSH36_168g03065 [Paralvinella palmiformis]|uniref:TNF receptor-associated factor n=1 Tax=Paralvinella palmiformis TaxID=53620 RepID=A0AAD9JT85_9ANNE|nr:hypothetical protein LSH36_168g03065 [Paralvinella palmiformis]